MNIIQCDESLDFWGRIFVDNNLDKMGVSFEDFMRKPFLPLASSRNPLSGMEVKHGLPRPLLPKQKTVLRKVIKDETSDGVRDLMQNFINRNGQFIERMYHKRWPRRQRRHYS